MMKRKATVIVITILIAAMGLSAILAGCQPTPTPEPVEPQAVRERICFICRTADNQIRNGYDLVFYSDDGSTQTAALEGSAGDLDLAGTLTTAVMVVTDTLFTDGETLIISDSVVVTGSLYSNGEALTIGDSVVITGSVTITGALNVDGNTDLDDVQVSGEFEATGASILTGTVTTVGNVTVGGGITVTENISIATGLGIAGATILEGMAAFRPENITPTPLVNGEHFTPTNVSLYVINSSAAVSMTLAACSNQGQVLWTYGDDANNVTINDTNVRTNDGGAQVLGQYDLVTWMCIGTEWIEVSESNNS